MIYGYVRVSTDQQDNENQRFEINNFCKRKDIKIDEWIAETISGTKDPKKRKLGKLLEIAQAGDLIICAEISRLGRSVFMIMEIMKGLLEKDVKVWTIKDNYRLDDSMQSKVLAFAFGLTAEIEREMISKRTKEALARLRMSGVRLGHPFGTTTGSTKLRGKQEIIISMVIDGYSQCNIARELEVHPQTIRDEIRRIGINPLQYKKRDIGYPRRSSILDGKADTVKVMLDGGVAKMDICRILNVHYMTLERFLEKKGWSVDGFARPRFKLAV